MTTHPYDALTPEVILDAVETFGVRATGALLALNGYENRVYRVDGKPTASWSPSSTARTAGRTRPSSRKTASRRCSPSTKSRWWRRSRTPAARSAVMPASVSHCFPWRPGRAPGLKPVTTANCSGAFSAAASPGRGGIVPAPADVDSRRVRRASRGGSAQQQFYPGRTRPGRQGHHRTIVAASQGKFRAWRFPHPLRLHATAISATFSGTPPDRSSWTSTIA